MSRNAETLVYEIQELYIDGSSARQIALALGTDIELVLSIINEWGASDIVEFSEENPSDM